MPSTTSTTTTNTAGLSLSVLLPDGSMGSPYSGTITATGGTTPYEFSLASGQLPNGLAFTGAGTISGMPSAGGTFNFAVKVTDAKKVTKQQSYQVVISAASPVAISLTPTTASAASGGTVQFAGSVTDTTNTGITWTVSAGTISSTGLFTAPKISTSGNVTVTATSVADPTKSATATVAVAATVVPVSITMNPTSATVASGATAQFTSAVSNSTNTSVLWTASQGTISSAGLYTAPRVSADTNATITATSVADSTKSASASITIDAAVLPVAITITPISTSVVSGVSSQFTAVVTNAANTSATWSASSGTVSSTGLYTAPQVSSNTSATVTATSVADPTKSATASITITASVAVTVSPTTMTLSSGASNHFSATVSNTANTGVVWSASEGTITSAGFYTAPTVSSRTTASVTVTSMADVTRSATATITITASSVTPVSISTSSTPGATQGSAYSTTLAASGGTVPYSWSISSGSLPAGIALSTLGTLNGTPTASGNFSFVVLVADSSSPQQTAVKSLTLAVTSSGAGSGLAKPAATYFGFSENGTGAANFPSVSYGMQRFWDSPPLQWPSINTAPGVFDFTNLDTALAQAYSTGVMEGFYTLARTPPWATSQPADANCHYATAASGGGNGECDAPADLNADGSGTNATWKAWITAIATHANDSGYLQTHAHIKYWEIWNEPDTSKFWSGSLAQLARLTEDANCIITGRGVIHQSGNGSATPCTATPIDATAQIVMASAHAVGVALTFGQNELYCNNTARIPSYQLPCPNPANAVAAAVDIINFHMKPGNETGNNCPAPTPCTPESAMQMYFSNVQSILQPAELAKPLWDGEAAYSEYGFTDAYTDPDMASSFMARFYLTNWSLGISGMAWYAWDDLLAQPAEVQTAYQQTYSWMANATLNAPCSASGTVWSCSITNAGTQYLILWDTAQSCSNGTCTTGNQTVAAQWTQYQQMTSGSAMSAIGGHAVPVGIKPIVLN